MLDSLRDLFLAALFHKESNQILVKKWNDEVERLQNVFDGMIDKSVISGLRPVVHAKWILHENGSATCSRCKTWQMLIYDDDSWQHYCGNCGAQMDGGEVEE